VGEKDVFVIQMVVELEGDEAGGEARVTHHVFVL
jgi:hypothetical protein